MTYTYAILEVSASTYNEIAGKLREAGYDYAIEDGVIDMHGIALQASPSPSREANDERREAHYRDVGALIPGKSPEPEPSKG